MADKLLAFCDPTSTRYALEKPWVVDGFRCATNGVVCVRTPSKRSDTADGKRRPRHLAELFEQFPTCDTPWPDLELVRTIVYCPNCRETVGVLGPVRVHNRRFRGVTYQLIAGLGAVRYAQLGTSDAPLFFEHRKIQGVVMPLPL